MYIGGKSEVALKEAVVDRYPRDSFQCATKLPLWDLKDPGEMEKIFQESLDRAGLEYYDFYLLHALSAEREKQADELGAWDFMKKLKAEGREKSATYRQLMGNKMQYQNMLSMYQIYGLR